MHNSMNPWPTYPDSSSRRVSIHHSATNEAARADEAIETGVERATAPRDCIVGCREKSNEAIDAVGGAVGPTSAAIGMRNCSARTLPLVRTRSPWIVGGADPIAWTAEHCEWTAGPK